MEAVAVLEETEHRLSALEQGKGGISRQVYAVLGGR